MLIRYCSNCIGKPYTLNMNSKICPACGASLDIESVTNEAELSSRPMLDDRVEVYNPDPYSNSDFETNIPPEFGGNYPYEHSGGSNYPSNYQREPNYPFDYNPTYPSEPNGSGFGDNNEQYQSFQKTSGNANCLIGRVTRYSSTGGEDGNYKRWFVHKIYDALVYGQRTDDILHRFYVQENLTDNAGYTNSTEIPVNVHGTISRGVNIRENDMVRVVGKYNRSGVFMAKEIYIINSGMESKVNFQHSPRAIAYLLLAILSVVLFMYTVLANGGSFGDNISKFFIAFIILFVVFSVLLIKFIFLYMIMRKGKSPFGIIFFLAFIATLIFWNIKGF